MALFAFLSADDTRHLVDDKPKLQIRQCADGCGHTFAVLPQSTQIYISQFHDKTISLKQRQDPHRSRRGRRKKRGVDFNEFIHHIDEVKD